MEYEGKTFTPVLTVCLISGLIVLLASQPYQAETILEADRLTISPDKKVARGGVKLTRSGWSLESNYLELKEENNTEEIMARGNVTLTFEKFTASADRLSGKLIEKGSKESLDLVLFEAGGQSGVVSFRGNELGVEIEENGISQLTIKSDAVLSFDGNSLRGNNIRAINLEDGWNFKATGKPEYESDSTELRAETITGRLLAEPEKNGSKTKLIIKRTTAGGNVRLTRSNWSLKSDQLELHGKGETEKLSAKGNVILSSNDFTARANHLSGRLTEEKSNELLKLTLVKATGNSESINFEGGKVDLEITDGSVASLDIEEGTKVTLGRDSYLFGNKADFDRSERGWEFEFSEEAGFERNTTSLRANKIKGRIQTSPGGGSRVSDVTVKKLSGTIEVEGNQGKTKSLQVLGESATLAFDGDSELSRADFSNGSFTSCEDCQCPGGCAYSVSADLTSLIERDFVLARFAGLKSFGFPVNWSPLYFLSLKDVGLKKRPYFPQIGYSSGGVSLSGAFPVFIDRSLFGNIVLDYFSQGQGVGLGLDYYSGGDTVNGIGEIYGVYRVFGDNFYKIDGTLNLGLTDWLEISTSINLKQGVNRGTEYDQNEWSLEFAGDGRALGWKTLISREEMAESDEESGYVIEKLPEIALSLSDTFRGDKLKLGAESSFGYYREAEPDRRERQGVRGELGGDFLVSSAPLDQLTLSLEGEGRVNPYLTTSIDKVTTRSWGRVEPELEFRGSGTLKTRFTHQFMAGRSPFRFDAIESMDRLNFNYTSNQGVISQDLSFHYDYVPADGFSKIKYEINFGQNSLQQKLGMNYDVSSASISSLTAGSVYSREKFGLNLTTGYNLETNSISETKFGINFSAKKNKAEVQLMSDPFGNWVKEISGELDLEFLETWSLGLKGEFDVQAGNISSLSYSLHNTLQNCLKVGITGDLTGLWFDVELAGF